MAWRFEPGERLPDAFRRVAAEEVARVEAGVKAKNANGVKATHEARQSFKRLRALLRLAGPTLGDGFSDESHRWREAGQRLATLRDGAVLRETFEQVVADSGNGMSANDIAALRAEIVHGSVEADNAETERVLRSVLSDLRGAKRRLATLNWPETADDLGRGLRASQSRLRKSWRRARRDRTPKALHHWRKRVKDQSAQLRLLRIAAPQEAKAWREVQKQVAEFLGDEHDLYLLAERLSCAAIPPRVEPARTHLLEAVKKHRKALRRRAFKAAEEGCSEKPGAFAAHLSAAWKTASKEQAGPPISRLR